MTVTAVEVAGQSAEYEWDAVDATSSFDRVTLYPDTDSRSLDPTSLQEAVHAAMEKIRPDGVAIPGWSEPAALAALEWCKETRTPSIVMSASSAIDAPRAGWREWIKGRIVRQFDAGVVGGSLHEDYLVDLGISRDRVFLGYDVVDNAHFAEGAAIARAEGEALRERYNLPPRYFLGVCRFVPKKNLSRLLYAYAAYRDRAGGDAWDLVLVGDGPERDAVERVRTQHGLTEAVRLPGFAQYDDLPIYYGLAQAFVHASIREQWGLVVNEAMASGLPVLISQRCGCVPDLVHPGENGVAFDPHDTADLARSLFDTAHGPESVHAMGMASQRIIASWSPARFADSLSAAALTAQDNFSSSASPFDRVLLKALMHR